MKARRARGPGEARKRYLEGKLRYWRRAYQCATINPFDKLKRKYARAMCDRYFQELKALKS